MSTVVSTSTPLPVISREYTTEDLQVREGERAVIARINTASIDRFNTIIDPLGIDLSHYNENRVVLWEHGTSTERGRQPIGRCNWIRVDRGMKSLVAKTTFGADKFSKQVFGWYQDGTIRGFSISVLSHEASPPSWDEKERDPGLERCSMIYRKSELTEYSAVAVPGNPEALAMEVSRGLWVPDERRQLLQEFLAKTPRRTQSGKEEDKDEETEDEETPEVEEPEPEKKEEEETEAEVETARKARARAIRLAALDAEAAKEAWLYSDLKNYLVREIRTQGRQLEDRIGAFLDLLKGRV